MEEQIKEVRVNEDPVDMFVHNNPPNPTPATGPKKEVVVKHDIIEQCAKRRPPLK